MSLMVLKRALVGLGLGIWDLATLDVPTITSSKKMHRVLSLFYFVCLGTNLSIKLDNLFAFIAIDR